jgi:hypothetical protein
MTHSHPSSHDSGTHLTCKSCDRIFAVCKLCYRGQVYCSVTCRQRARRLKQRAYSRAYAATDKARAHARSRQKRHRERMRRGGVTEHARSPQWSLAQGVAVGRAISGQMKSDATASRRSGRPLRFPAFRPTKRCQSVFSRCRRCGSSIRWLPAVPFDVRTQFNARHFGQRRLRLSAVFWSAVRGF